MFLLEEHLDFFALCEPYYIGKTLEATGMQNVFTCQQFAKKDHRKKYQGASVAA